MASPIARWGLVIAFAWGLGARRCQAQGPALPQELPPSPGTTSSPFRASPGAGVVPFGNSPGAGGEVLGGRPGPASARVPATFATPGGAAGGEPPRASIAPPRNLPPARVPAYGSFEVPTGRAAEGPPNGLTLDLAIDRLLKENLDLRSRFMEIPQAQADILTASLRANPFLYADAELVPYGSYSKNRPGGPNQYDVNINYPLDISGKRRARTDVAARAKRVLEAQYQDAVRLEINNLYTAYIDVLAAQERVRYARASLDGLQKLLEVIQSLYQRSTTTKADVDRVAIQRDSAEAGLVDEQESLLRTKRTLGTLLFLPPALSDALEVLGTIGDQVQPPPPADELIRIALCARPDLVAYRLGIQRAESDVRLAEANKLQDVYLLYQPYTFQNNAPFQEKSAHSWAVGMTVPLPVYNRNQGVIQRARLNVAQTKMELAALERQVINEVLQAEREYQVSRAAIGRIERGQLPAARHLVDDTYRLFTSGGADVVAHLAAQRDRNDVVRQYLDTIVRHRRSMLALNTAVGQRILP